MPPKKSKINQRETSDPEDFFMNLVDDNADAKLLEEIAQKPSLDGRAAAQDWFAESFDGQLTVDVYQTDKDIIIQAAVAGVRGEDLDLELSNDMVTIKGIRRMKYEVADDDYLIRECYFGGFSRSIILPVDILHDKVRATLELGLLTVILPKSNKSRHSKISVQEIN
jgi:HSP20 family protein